MPTTVSSATATRQAPADVGALIETMRPRSLGRGCGGVPAPGDFWDQLIDQNLEMLRTHGVANFKRTVSNNYYNWLVTSLRDPQNPSALCGAGCNGHRSSPLLTHLEDGPSVQAHDRSRGRLLSLEIRELALQVFGGAAWEAARHEQDALGPDTSGCLSRELGNPIRISHRGRLSTQDLANSIIECKLRGSYWSNCARGARIAELGAGYGQGGGRLREDCPMTYCIFDIPPALGSPRKSDERFRRRADRAVYPGDDFSAVESRLKPGVVGFFPPISWRCSPTDGSTAPRPSALCRRCLPSSRRTTCASSAKSRRAVFLKQWKRWRNAADDVDSREHYNLPEPWRLDIAARSRPACLFQSVVARQPPGVGLRRRSRQVGWPSGVLAGLGERCGSG